MSQEKPSVLYRCIRFVVRLVYPKMQVRGAENLPQEPVIVVANHCQTNGPIACELYFPGDRYTWCAGQMMHWKEVPEYAFRDFWWQKPRWTHPFYRLLAYLITPLSVCVFNNARTIGVYRDARILSTFKTTVNRLSQGSSVVIFPEHDAPYDHILNDFQDKFIDIARLYYKRTGKELAFVPMYIAPRLHIMSIGKPIRFRASESMDTERARIAAQLKRDISALAQELPEHTVVPYRKLPGVKYPKNK